MRRASLVLAASLAATPLMAQQQLSMGTQINGVLTVSSPQWQDGTRYVPYIFYGQAGQPVTITMSSGEFDTYLILQDQGGNQIALNDDADGTNARINVTLGYSGPYRIIAKAYRADNYGSYTLALMGSAPIAMGVPQPIGGGTMGGPTVAGTIGANQQVTGNLTNMDGRYDNKPAHAWSFQCMAGQPVQMDILSSWDNYAVIIDPAGNRAAFDDDTGESLNARINHTCAMSGMYRLLVTTYTSSTTPGTYTLQVQSTGAVAMQPQPIPQPMPQAMPQPMPMAPQSAPGATMPTPVGTTLPVTGSIAAPGQIATITMGTNMQGRLETGDQQMNDGTWADVWQFQGTAGQRVRIELRSEEFDTYVQLLDGRDAQLAEDDDALGDLDSMIEFTLPATGTYKIVVNNYSEERRAGIYTLTLR